MVKGRVRIKPAGKAKRWRKGQSGATNPVSKTHREAAKGRFGNHLAQSTLKQDPSVKLTADVLASHDAHNHDNRVDALMEEVESSQGNASAHSLIETSHPVFGKVKRLWNSPDESHKEICAVLAAVTEVVRSKSGTDNETEYFGALLTALEAAESVPSTTAIAFLLSIVMERVPSSVLDLRFSQVSKVLISQLTQHESSASTSLLKSLIGCVSVLLSAQPQPKWKDSYVQTMLQTVVNFTVHPKPKIRKSAQQRIVTMLRGGGGVEIDHFHPSCSLIFKQCQRTIESGVNDTVKLHVLGLLKDCFGNFNTKQIKGLCESLLKLLTLGTSIMKMTCFQCLNGLFSCVAGPRGITGELNGQLISALHNHQPGVNDSQLLMAWGTVIESAYLSLQRLDQSLCTAHLPNLFTVFMKCLLGSKRNCVVLITKIMINILKTCVKPIIVELTEESMDSDHKSYGIAQSVFSIIETGLSYKYYEVWDLVLTVLETFYTISSKPCSKFLKKSLLSLNELHHTANFPCVPELEAAFGEAIKSLGPRFVLSAVPLKLDEVNGKPDFPQSWILPVLKTHVCKTELVYFTNEFLPLAGKLRGLSEEWNSKGKGLERKLYETLEYQIWSLLPSFCKGCTDIASSFPSIAKLLGSALNDRPDIRPLVCQSINNLIEESLKKESDRLVLAKFSKNFLPILFNHYSTITDDSARGLLLHCIKSYLSITQDKLLSSLFSKLLSKIQDGGDSSTSKASLEDIAEAFIPFLTSNQISNLFETTCPNIDSGNLAHQKKFYKLLSGILSCDSSEHSLFVEENITRLQKLLLGSLSTAGAGSKKPRLRCLIQIVAKIDSESADFIAAVVPESILCTKEPNEKCRNLAYQLLKNLGYAAQRCYQLTPEESIQKYFMIVLAGLAGSTHMISATIGAMARLVYEFNDILGSELISKLLSAVCEFFSAKSKEVVRSTLIFVKVAIGVLPISELAPHVEELVTKILRWNENHKSHFRMKSKYILEKLTQKFSYKMVNEFVPEKHKKLLTHIRKTVERKKKQQRKEQMEDTPKNDDEDFIKVKRRSTAKPSLEELLRDSDEEDDREVHVKGRKVKGHNERGTWLDEEDDEPLDFMDPSITKKITGTRPSKSRQISRDSFKTGLNGKLIIDDDDEEMMEDLSDEEDLSETDDYRTREGRKRKVSFMLEGDKGIDSGSGIFRKDPKNTTKEFGVEYKAKKAKGDIKKEGKPDPYAYIQLNRQKLNKRKRAKLSGEFKNILNKAKKGAAKGHKLK